MIHVEVSVIIFFKFVFSSFS